MPSASSCCVLPERDFGTMSSATSEDWALFVQVAVEVRWPHAGRLPRNFTRSLPEVPGTQVGRLWPGRSWKLKRRFNLILNRESGRQTLKGRTAVKKSYHTINKQGKANERKLAEFLSKNGQLLLPMVDLIEQC